MEAMILAAGAGTRLKPITDRIPKALVAVRGRPLMAHVLDRLEEIGVTRAIVNAHHHEAKIRSFLAANRRRNLEVVLSPEPDGPYDTGGGLFTAAALFRESSPFLLHNVDVLSTIPLSGLFQSHRDAEEASQPPPVASVAVTSQQAKRKLLFDDAGLLGWENTGSDRAVLESRRVRDPVGSIVSRAFTGIHVVDPKVFSLSKRTGTFSIVELYLELAEAGYRIKPVDVSVHDWIDVGTRQRLAEAESGEWGTGSWER